MVEDVQPAGEAPVTPPQAARETASIGPVAGAERGSAIRALAEAFQADPLMSWVCPDGSRRLRRLERGFGFLGERLWFDHDLVFGTQGGAGAAIWVPPDGRHVGVLDQLRMLPGMLRAFGARDLRRLMHVLNLIEADHPEEPHYYLPLIGVRPAWQGKGLGTALLRPILARCDEEQLPAYLEASSPRNRACYERNGFRVVRQLQPRGGPPIWPMWRLPATGAARRR